MAEVSYERKITALLVIDPRWHDEPQLQTSSWSASKNDSVKHPE